MKIAFLIIDVQTSFVERPELKEKFLEAKDYINYVSSLFRRKDMPVVHIRHIEGVKEDAVGYEVSKEIVQEESDIQIIKNVGNAFYGTDLEKILKKAEVDFVLLSGLSAIHCVLATFNGANERGFKTGMLKKSLIGSEVQVKIVEDSFSVVTYDIVEHLLSKY